MAGLLVILLGKEVKNFGFELGPTHEADFRQDILFVG